MALYGILSLISFPVLAGILILLSLFFVMQWRRVLIILFLWLCFEGLVRKIWPGKAVPAIFFKDYLVALIYISFFMDIYIQKRRKWKNPLLPSLLMLFAFAAAQSFNPKIDNFLVPLLGLKAMFYYVPLLYVGYWSFNRAEDLVWFYQMLLWTAIPVTLLGINQLLTQDISTQALFGAALHTHSFSGHTTLLPTSVFTGEGRFARYMLFLFLMGVGLIGSGKMSQAKSAIFCTVICFLGALAAGRRLDLLLLLISPLFIISIDKLPAFTHKAVRKKRNFFGGRLPAIIIASFLVIAGTSYILVQTFFSKSALSTTMKFYAFTVAEQPKSETSARFAGQQRQITYALEKAQYIIGNGTGSNTQGSQYLVKDYRAGVEGGVAKIIWELGLFGLLIYACVIFRLFSYSYNLVIRCRHHPLHFFGIAVIAFHLVFIFSSIKACQYMDDAFQDIYLWFTTGVLFSIPRIIALEQYRAGQRAVFVPGSGPERNRASSYSLDERRRYL